MAKKVFIFVPAFGGTIRSETVKTLLALQGVLGSKGILTAYSDFSFPDVAEARAIATTIWYDTMPDCDYLLFIDSDMGFDPSLVLDMFLFDEPLVGAIYPQRRIPLGWAGSGNNGISTERRGDFMVVEGVGFGATLVRRDVIRLMLEQMPQISDERISLHPAGAMLTGANCKRLIRAFEKLDVPDRGVISEDLSFCIRWANCTLPDGTKGKTWASIGHRISHVGPYDFAGRYLDVIEALERQQNAPPQTLAAAVASAIASTMPLPIEKAIVESIEPISEAAE
jgi:hypothetical protein